MKRSVKNGLNRFKRDMISALCGIDQVMRSKSVATIKFEVEELDNIFALLVLGAFIGIPSPPIHVTTELLPFMEDDLCLMIDKVTTAYDPLGNLFSVFQIG